MAIKPRNLALNATIGVAVAALIIVGIFASGIRFPTARTGTLLVLLTDDPVELLELNVAIESFAVHRVGEGWIELPLSIDPTEPFNLLDLQNGVTMELVEDEEMNTGTYNKIRLTVEDSATALVAGENDPRELMVPPGHLDVITNFEIVSEETTMLIVDMTADWAAISQSNQLRPVIKASVVGQASQSPPPEV